MSERDFSIGERNFKLSKIDALKQFHIVRRLAPLLGDLIPVAQKLQKMGEINVEQLTEEQMAVFGPSVSKALELFSKLSDDDSEMVLKGLCAAVEIQQERNWARLVAGNAFMFQDLSLPVLLQCAGRAFLYNLGSFSNALPKVSHGGA